MASTTDNLTPIGRLAMRVEGQWWVAYYAETNTMDGAIDLGRIKMTFVQDQNRKALFMDLMREAVSDIVEQKTGKRLLWPDGAHRAPESERSGSA